MKRDSRIARALPWMLALSLLANLGVAVGFAAVTLMSEPESPQPEPLPVGHESKRDRFVAQLERYASIDEAQEKAIVEARAALNSALVPVKEEIRDRKHSLAMLIASDAPDIKALRAETAAIARSQQEIQDLTVDHLLTMRRLLNTEQQKGFNALLQQRMCTNPMCSAACVGCTGCAAKAGADVLGAASPGCAGCGVSEGAELVGGGGCSGGHGAHGEAFVSAQEGSEEGLTCSPGAAVDEPIPAPNEGAVGAGSCGGFQSTSCGCNGASEE